MAAIKISIAHLPSGDDRSTSTKICRKSIGNLAAAEQHGLVLLDLPCEPLKVQVEAVWHRRADRDASARWLVTELFDGTIDVT